MRIVWITTKEWEDGEYNIPKKTETAQAYIRTKRKIQYTKNGKKVIYKKEWIMDYLDSNIKKAQPKANK